MNLAKIPAKLGAYVPILKKATDDHSEFNSVQNWTWMGLTLLMTIITFVPNHRFLLFELGENQMQLCS